jgi:hypothetical protein
MVKNPLHNHKASGAATVHPIHHRMPPEVKEEVRRLTAAEVTARQIVTIIQQNTDYSLIA